MIEIVTERLLLRQWRKEDLSHFAKLNADPVVMQYYPNLLSAEESNCMADKFESLISEKGWGFWAVELLSRNSFIGFAGLHEPTYELPVSPCIEIGWRLAREYWSMGYATEAASASLETAFLGLELSEIFSFTSVSNMKSRAVMERLHMIDTHLNFEHPTIPENSPLREHVLYKIDKIRWANMTENKY